MTAWNYAASDVSEQIAFLEHVDHPSSSSMLAGTQACHDLMPFTQKETRHTVQAVRLDQLFAEHAVRLAGDILLKLDVQGAEAKVLRGCSGFLSQVSTAIVEINLMPLYEGQSSLIEICTVLNEHDLQFSGVLEQFHADNGAPIYVDAVFSRQS
jgi:FkbM family methyltransferase